MVDLPVWAQISMAKQAKRRLNRNANISRCARNQKSVELYEVNPYKYGSLAQLYYAVLMLRYGACTFLRRSSIPNLKVSRDSLD